MEEKRRTPQLPWPEWKIEGLLGRGGFGDVYRIRREEYGNISLAALKVVRIPSDESEIQELEANGISVGSYYKGMISDLLKEISLMESLKAATNVVTIDDYKIIEKKDSVGWVLFIRMELLTNLNVYRKSHVMSVKEVFKLGFDICSALEACQKKGIVHRDIKPSNILVSEFGDFKLGDFGISRNLTHTMSGLSRKGTELYMAPEVYRGNKYNATVDIYSLGLVLYSLLNHGRLPFFPRVPAEVTKNDSMDAFSKRMRGEKFPDPDEGGREIGDVLRKACHIDPKMRYQSAAEFKAALVSCQGQENVKTKPHPMKPRHIEPKVQIPAQKPDISEETVAADSWKKEHTPVIKTENKKQRTTKKTEGSWKYAVLGIGLLALAGVAGAITFQKRPNSDPEKKVVTAEPTATPTPEPTATPTSEPTPTATPEPTATPTPEPTPTPTPTVDEIMSQKWEQVYYVLDEMTSQGVFSYIGKPKQELQEYLLAQGWEVSSGNDYMHLQTGEQIFAHTYNGEEITSIMIPFNSPNYENSVVNLGSAEELRKADNREEIYDLLGITPEMIEWVVNNGQENMKYNGIFYLLFNENWRVNVQSDSIKGVTCPFFRIDNGEKSIALYFESKNEETLFCMSVDIM